MVLLLACDDSCGIGSGERISRLEEHVMVPKEITNPDEYRAWIKDHQVRIGFVANYSSSKFTIHKATCGYIKKSGSGGVRKIVSTGFIELVNWCDSNHPEAKSINQCRCMRGVGHLEKAFFFLSSIDLARRGQIHKAYLPKPRISDERSDGFLVLVEGGRELGVFAYGKIIRRGKSETPESRGKYEEATAGMTYNFYSGSERRYECWLEFEVSKIIPDPLLKDDLDEDLKNGSNQKDRFPGHFRKVEKSDPQDRFDAFQLPTNRLRFRQWEVLKKEFGLGPPLLL